jgi:PsbP
VKRFAIGFCAVLVFVPPGIASRIEAQNNLQEYLDREYGYSFRYPAVWKAQKLPEGPANKDVRVRVNGPNGSSFTVVIDRLGKSRSRAEFEADPNRTKHVEELMQQTMAQVYQSVSTNIKAEQMTVGERRDLTNDVGIKFYISTLHTRKTGNPIIVAGIHSYPFSKDYSINFVMTAFWDSTANKENEILKTVFNSFHLLHESRDPVK